MRNRFSQKRAIFSLRGPLLSVVALVLVLAAFAGGIDAISNTARAEQLHSAQQAVARAAVHCYAVEGAYPDSLAYLEDHYGLAIDTDRYTVHYNCFASNLMPEIDVIPKNQ